jgi:hypothetical protein
MERVLAAKLASLIPPTSESELVTAMLSQVGSIMRLGTARLAMGVNDTTAGENCYLK